jgi:hypothetical protein
MQCLYSGQEPQDLGTITTVKVYNCKRDSKHTSVLRLVLKIESMSVCECRHVYSS